MFQKKNDLEVVLELLKGDNHLRAIASAVGLSLATAKRTLDYLVGANIIDARREGRNRVFSLKKGVEARECVLAAEHYKTLKVLDAYPYLAPRMEETLEKGKGMVILFGSHAGLRAKKGSDVDVYCEGGGPGAKSGRFDGKSPLVREIIKNHAIFRGAEEFYERTGFFEEGR